MRQNELSDYGGAPTITSNTNNFTLTEEMKEFVAIFFFRDCTALMLYFTSRLLLKCERFIDDAVRPFISARDNIDDLA